VIKFRKTAYSFIGIAEYTIYFHDFSSMEIDSVFSYPYEGVGRFAEFDHTTKFGIPSEHSRLTGFSLQVFFNLGYSRAEKKEPEAVAPETEQ
jgi:hypothetical protein